MHDAAIDVAPQVIAAEPVVGARAGERVGGVGRDRIVRREGLGEDRRQQHHQHDPAPDRAERLLRTEAADRRPRAGAGGRASGDGDNVEAGFAGDLDVSHRDQA